MKGYFLLLAALVVGNPTLVTTPTEIACNLELMRSYLLKGREKSSATETLLLCPGVANNCCVRQDQQRIFHTVNDVLPARLAEYNSKVRQALARLKAFHKRVAATSPVILGSERRRRFCRRQARVVLNFPFNALHQSLLDQLTALEEDMASHYRSFFCVLCDASNHPFFEFAGTTKKAIFDLNFCREFLGARTEILRALNVELLDYLVALQNLVDCTHYVKSFDLPFFAPDHVRYKGEVTTCLNFLGSKSFARHCRPLCERLTLSKVITAVQGDADFLSDAANLFEKFHDFRESGNFISSKLRTFFRRFALPPTSTKKRKLVKSSGRSLVSLWARNLGQIEEPAAVVKTTHRQESEGPMPDRRLLAADPAPTATKARVAVDPTLANFYSQIALPPKHTGDRVYPVQGEPIDFERPLKTWSLGNGINPSKYEQSGFSLSPQRFYRMLYNFRHREPADVSLQFFLSDFTTEALEDSLTEVKETFKMDPKQFLLEPATDAAEPHQPRVLSASPSKTLLVNR